VILVLEASEIRTSMVSTVSLGVAPRNPLMALYSTGSTLLPLMKYETLGANYDSWSRSAEISWHMQAQRTTNHIASGTIRVPSK